jgi:hypothetical protein
MAKVGVARPVWASLVPVAASRACRLDSGGIYVMLQLEIAMVGMVSERSHVQEREDGIDLMVDQWC